MTIAPFGTWESSISGEYLASRSTRLSEPRWWGDSLFWLEARPQEQGRQVIVCATAQGQVVDILPAPWNARSKAHEYGGGNYCLSAEQVFFVHADDQQIYAYQRRDGSVKPLSQMPDCRFADLFYDGLGHRLYAIGEDHSQSPQPQNRLVRFSLDQPWPAACDTIDGDHDFISNPQVSPDGSWLSYLTWDHPHMPWEATQLWLREVDPQGVVGEARLVAGDPQESLFQPQWGPGGDLYWVSDRSNWWNIMRLPQGSLTEVVQASHRTAVASIAPMASEFATPQWVFGMSTFGFLDAHNIIATYTQNGSWHLVRLQLTGEVWHERDIPCDCNTISHVRAQSGKAAFVGASATYPAAIFTLEDDNLRQVSPRLELEEAGISSAQAVQFACKSGSDHAHGFYYPPRNQHYQGPKDGAPPLIVIGHGGPTGACDPSFNYKTQFWTNRGFAVLDVNYRGSTGFGRRYRDSLRGLWGVADVEDLCSAAQYAVAQGWAHPEQLIIRGSSAGGYSVLAALTDTNTFNAGVSLYGIGDLELLAKDTHKFESHYLDSLIGPYPQQKALYIERSPIHKVAQIGCPLLVFQGLLDKVVPPNQAELMVATVKQMGFPVAYVTYSDEGHGFRNGDNICHQAEAELTFYQMLFALGPLPSKPMIELANWP